MGPRVKPADDGGRRGGTRGGVRGVAISPQPPSWPGEDPATFRGAAGWVRGSSPRMTVVGGAGPARVARGCGLAPTAVMAGRRPGHHSRHCGMGPRVKPADDGGRRGGTSGVARVAITPHRRHGRAKTRPPNSRRRVRGSSPQMTVVGGAGPAGVVRGCDNAAPPSWPGEDPATFRGAVGWVRGSSPRMTVVGGVGPAGLRGAAITPHRRHGRAKTRPPYEALRDGSAGQARG